MADAHNDTLPAYDPDLPWTTLGPEFTTLLTALIADGIVDPNSPLPSLIRVDTVTEEVTVDFNTTGWVGTAQEWLDD